MDHKNKYIAVLLFTGILLTCLYFGCSSLCTGSIKNAVFPEEDRNKTTYSDYSEKKIAFRKDFLAARTESQEKEIPLMYFFYAPWSTYSEKMLQDILYDPFLASQCQNFIPVMVEAQICPQLCDEFRVKEFPSILFVSPKGIILGRISGFQNSRRIADTMNTVLSISHFQARQDNTTSTVPY